MSEEDLTTLNVNGKDVSEDEAMSGAWEEKMKQVTRSTFLLNITQVGTNTCTFAVNLTVVHLPEGILHILKCAFRFCSNLTDVRFPKSLILIGWASFYGCNNLGDVDLQDTNLQELGQQAFGDCSNLTSMFIPDSLQRLGDCVFYKCSKLVPSNINVKYNDAVVAYLRSQEDLRWQSTESAFKLTPFEVFFDRPLLVKFIIQTSPDATIDAKTPAACAKEKNAPQLIVDMLGFLTADEMKACDTESAIQAAIDEKMATIMAGVVDFTAREKATALQTKMFGELGAADVDGAHATFDQLKVFCGDQAKRLGDLIAVVMSKYKTTDAKRYTPFEQVKDMKVKEQTTPSSAPPLPDQVKYQLAKATWYEEEFQAAMNEIAAIFNDARSCEEICEHYGIDNADGRWSKKLRVEVFNLDHNTDEVVMVKFGPPKSFPRALEKMEQGKTLRDLNRVTFEFEDPLLMALCVEVLNKKYNIHGLKNKYLQETLKEPLNLHMNLEIKDGWLCEVQMLLRDILLIKKELYKFYDVNRADGPFVVARRLFKFLADPEDKPQSSTIPHGNAKDAETESLKRENRSLKRENERLTKLLAEKPPPAPKKNWKGFFKR